MTQNVPLSAALRPQTGRIVPRYISQNRTLFRFLGAVLVLFAGVLTLAGRARAQTGTQATLTTLQLTDYPKISAYLDVRDAAGKFISGLQPRQVQIVEDGQKLPAAELREQRAGAQFVVAINPGPPFAIRDSQGNSRYDYLMQALQVWAAGADTSLDDLSLLTTTGAEETHLDSASAFGAALENFQPDLRAAVPGLDVLARALDVAADPALRTGMGRAILFLTPPPDANGQAALQSLAARATQANIRVFVWLVASSNLFDSVGAQALKDLAAQTGGQFFAYSGIEALPDLEIYLEPNRSVYWLAYDSQIRGSGTHEVLVNLALPEGELATSVQTFNLDIAPPNPVFVSPPSKVTRVLAESGASERDALLPHSQSLELLIEFPDGHDRPLERTILYVNGEVAAENTAPPFDRFLWDLSDYASVGRYLLQVEVIDSLGLRGVSIETPIQIAIEQPRRDALAVLSRNGPALAGAAIVMAGAVLVFVLIIGGRIRPRAYLPRRPARGAQGGIPTRPVARARTKPSTTRRLSDWTVGLPAHLPRTVIRSKPVPLAYLTRLTNMDRRQAKAEPIPITAKEFVLGTDTKRAALVLDDSSIDALHAQIRRKGDGTFQLKDLGSVAGTWINYAPLSHEWTHLEDGDLLHVGRIGFRFSLGKIPRGRRTKITFEEKL
jgi:hypothetical protein